jgi:hypothetical protein
MLHVEAEQKLDKLNRRLLMMNHLQLEQFYMENKLQLIEMH